MAAFRKMIVSSENSNNHGECKRRRELLDVGCTSLTRVESNRSELCNLWKVGYILTSQAYHWTYSMDNQKRASFHSICVIREVINILHLRLTVMSLAGFPACFEEHPFPL